MQQLQAVANVADVILSDKIRFERDQRIGKIIVI